MLRIRATTPKAYSSAKTPLIPVRPRSGFGGVSCGPGAFCVMMRGENSLEKAVPVIAKPKSKCLDQTRQVLPLKHYSSPKQDMYVQWALRYPKFHRHQAGVWKHPRELGGTEAVAFLNHLVNADRVAAATRNQALNAIFAYSQVPGLQFSDFPAS